MKWKKFKKERISLNYTVMLLPHSQKKPIHFKTPVWTFGLFFLGLLILSGACLFFAGSRVQLKQVQAEKNHLEREWEKLAAQKEKADKENEELKQARENQEQELKKLEQKTRESIKELEDLVERENQIRQELGLGQVAGAGSLGAEALPQNQEQESLEGQEADSGEAGAGEGQDADSGEAGAMEGQEADSGEAGAMEGQDADSGENGSLEGQNIEAITDGTPEGAVPLANRGMMQAFAADYSAILAENTAGFQDIQKELAFLQASLTEKTSQYDSYLHTIEAKREAEAAEIARREALRLSIVRNALQYVGNPYVYGGNNPNTGVDCSGFTKYIMANTAGVYLNRTAASQSTQGQAVSAEEARPGDLVFYSNGASVNHVAIYIGEGRVVHASNERVGITTSNMYYRTPVKIVNVLGD